MPSNSIHRSTSPVRQSGWQISYSFFQEMKQIPQEMLFVCHTPKTNTLTNIRGLEVGRIRSVSFRTRSSSSFSSISSSTLRIINNKYKACVLEKIEARAKCAFIFRGYFFALYTMRYERRILDTRPRCEWKCLVFVCFSFTKYIKRAPFRSSNPIICLYMCIQERVCRKGIKSING
jgi:hypothetical protein